MKPLLKAKLDSGAPDVSKAIIVPPRITVKDLAEVLSISSVDIIKELMKSGIMAPIARIIIEEIAQHSEEILEALATLALIGATFLARSILRNIFRPE